MRIEVHVHHHFADEGTLRKLIREEVQKVTQKLLAAVAALTATVQAETTVLQSVTAYVQGVPDLVAKAVADALAAHDVDDDEAADTIEAARASVESAVTSVLNAIPQNTPQGGDTTPAGDGNDTISAGGGDDTVSEGGEEPTAA